jgi:hypothetical protein
VAAHVRTHPEDPCVVFPDAKGDWRWKPWRWLATEAQRSASALRAARIEPGARIGYRWRPAPEVAAADLGIQAAGATAVPVVDGDEAATPGLDGWLTSADDAPDGLATRVIALPGDVERQGPAAALAAANASRSGGALVRRGDSWQPWSASDLARAAAALAPSPPRRARPIALVAGDLAAAEERAWLCWSLAAGAVLVLPTDSAFAAWAIFWPRPTDVLLPAPQLPAVRELLAGLGSLRVQRRRLKRLQRLLVWGGEPPSGEATAWRELEVHLEPWRLA